MDDDWWNTPEDNPVFGPGPRTRVPRCAVCNHYIESREGDWVHDWVAAYMNELEMDACGEHIPPSWPDNVEPHHIVLPDWLPE